MSLGPGGFFDLSKDIRHDIRDRHELLGIAGLDQIEDLLLRIVQDIIEFSTLCIAVGRDLFRCPDQPSEGRFLIDDPRVLLRVYGRIDTADDIFDQIFAPDFLRYTVFFHPVQDSYRIYSPVFPEQCCNGIKNSSVLLIIEVFSGQEFHHRTDHFIVDKHRAKHGLFGFYIIGHDPFEQFIIRHTVSFPFLYSSSTFTRRLAVTSLCSFTFTLWSPRALIGSARTIFFLSTSSPV